MRDPDAIITELGLKPAQRYVLGQDPFEGFELATPDPEPGP